MRKIKVALKYPKTDLGVIARAKYIAQCMTGNPYVPSPPVAIATLLALIAEAEAAQITVRSGLHGAATARDSRLVDVRNCLEQLRTYVETVANAHGPDGEAVVVSCGMYVKQSRGPGRAPFSAKQGKLPGSVVLRARRTRRAQAFQWQLSLDGVTWVDVGESTDAEMKIEGLSLGKMYWFRYRTLTREGRSDWSDPLQLFVV